jgi:CRISPR type III-A-associated RAMP protein Csm4
MSVSLLVQIRPQGPWRSGPDSGARDRVDPVYHSDALFSALTAQMFALGRGEDWLAATAESSDPAVRLTSCFPMYGDLLYVAPPRHLRPPQSSKVRFDAARFVPASLLDGVIAGEAINEDKWLVDGESECVIAQHHRSGPFRMALRSAAAVDRLGQGVEPHTTACVEFAPSAGLWCAAAFRDDAARGEWIDQVRGAFQLLGDTGAGGERSRGWGRFEASFREGDLAKILLPKASAAERAGESAWWLLSLYSPADGDAVAWDRGDYTLVTRSGRIESAAGAGLKRSARMVAEGSVIESAVEPKGAAVNVAPEGFAHPVWRAGFAVALAVPAMEAAG